MFAAVMFLTLLLSSTSATPLRQHVTNSTLAYKRQSGFPYATEKVRGVNLGELHIRGERHHENRR